MKEHLVERVVRNGLCMGCGMCVASSSKADIRLTFSKTEDQFIPRVERWTPEDGDDPELVCPGARVDMMELSLRMYGRVPDDYLLGVYERVRICYVTDEQTRCRAASGGVVPVALRYLFTTGAIDMVYCLVPGEGPYAARGRILRSAAEIDQIHGSVYHPFDFGNELRELVKGEGRFALVGLPCQIEGLEMMKARNPALAHRHVLSIGLFCGGVNKFGGIAYYLRGHGIPWHDVSKIEYRVGDWPGQIRVRRASSEREVLIPRIQGNSRWQILRYTAAFQGYWMMKRCRLCPDQLADFADIAVGDPHVPKYRKKKGPGYSIVVSRTRRGEQFIQEMLDKSLLAKEECDTDLVKDSQGYTLDNRRHVPAYIRIARFLGEPVPELSVYPEVSRHVSFRHYKYALVDLGKILIRKHTYLQPFYAFLQALEYLFITFYPSLFVKRLKRLGFNRGKR